MSAIAEFIEQIKGWINFDYSDDLVTSWIRMAEERINTELRVREMIKVDRGLFIQDPTAPLPEDWLEMDLVRRLDRKEPLRYSDRHDFYTKDTDGYYTIIGDFIVIGGPFNKGVEVEIYSYRQVPPLGEEATWLYKKHPRLYTAAVLTMAVAYGVEDERAPMWEAEVSTRISQLNAAHRLSRASGSRITRRPINRSFG